MNPVGLLSLLALLLAGCQRPAPTLTPDELHQAIRTYCLAHQEAFAVADIDPMDCAISMSKLIELKLIEVSQVLP